MLDHQGMTQILNCFVIKSLTYLFFCSVPNQSSQIVPPRPNSNYSHTPSPSPANQGQQQPQQSNTNQQQPTNSNRQQFQEYNQFNANNSSNNEGSQSRPSSVSWWSSRCVMPSKGMVLAGQQRYKPKSPHSKSKLSAEQSTDPATDSTVANSTTNCVC